MLQTATANMGHNNPPTDDEVMRERLQERAQELLDDAATLLDEAVFLPKEIEEQQQADNFSDFIKKINDCNKRIETKRKEEKQPYLDAGRRVDKFFDKPITDLTAAATQAKKPLTVFLNKQEEEQRKFLAAQAERERLASEQKIAEAAKQQDQGNDVKAEVALKEAVQAEKEANSIERTLEQGTGLVKSSGYIGTGTLRKRWIGEIVDRSRIDWTVIGPRIDDAAVQKAINAFVAAGGRELAGINIYEKSEAVVK